MNWDAITAAAELAGLIAIVVSLVYIGIQTKQTNDHVTASSEIDWIHGWNQVLNSWVSDERTTAIIRKGFHSFNDLQPSEQAVFHMRIGALVNQWLLAQKLIEKDLVSQDIADEVTKLIVATQTTQGGFEYFEHDWKLFPGGAELMELVKNSKGKDPCLTDILPWWSDDESD